MMGSKPIHPSPFLLVLTLVLGMLLVLGVILALPSPAAASPAAFQPVPQPAAGGAGQPFQQTDNEACLSCHEQPGMTMPLSGGETLFITVDPEVYAASVHGENQVACTACHKDITGYPHPPFTATDVRETAISMYNLCQDCHTDQYQQAADSVHQAVLAGGNKNAAVCSDCHNPHAQVRMTNPDTGALFPEARVGIPETCARCHSAIFDEYANSAHGALLVRTGNLDVPTCTECHGVHNIPDPTTAQFRITSPQLCASCHVDEVKMAKYGLSTQVLSTYVSDFHGTTVTLFQKQNPEQASNKPVCFDCHGAHAIAKVDDPERGLKIKENMLVSCQRCHPGATANFPDSWMSHYIATPTTFPLVFYVNWFYKILIPLVIGGMIVYVITDFIRRRIDRRKGATHA